MTESAHGDDDDPADAAFAHRADDLAAAVATLSQLVEKGSVRAHVCLGWLYQQGEGVPQDLAQAEQLFRVASAGGDAEADDYLGHLYRNRGAYAKARESFALGAARGNLACTEEVQATLDHEYKERLGTLRRLLDSEPIRAFEGFQKLSEQGIASAMGFLAWCYRWGIGTPMDLTQAQVWYERALATGSAWVGGDAAYRLGGLHLTQKRYAQAHAVLAQGAALHNARCLYLLGTLYGRGRGVVRDRDQAYALYEQAARGGYLPAVTGMSYQMIAGRRGMGQILPGLWLFIRNLGQGIRLLCTDSDNPNLG